MRNTKYKNLESFWGRGDKKCRSVPAPFLGTLFVYKNNFWSKSQSALNITHFDMKQWAAKKALMNGLAPEKMGMIPPKKTVRIPGDPRGFRNFFGASPSEVLYIYSNIYI
jgi:hypothetical protein